MSTACLPQQMCLYRFYSLVTVQAGVHPADVCPAALQVRVFSHAAVRAAAAIMRSHVYQALHTHQLSHVLKLQHMPARHLCALQLTWELFSNVFKVLRSSV